MIAILRVTDQVSCNGCTRPGSRILYKIVSDGPVVPVYCEDCLFEIKIAAGRVERLRQKASRG